MTERYISPADPCTSLERELLNILIEEAAESQQRATKMLRFGPFEVQPGQPLTNVERFSLEIGDLLAMIDIVQKCGLISAAHVAEGRARKPEQLKKFLQYPDWPR